MKNILNQITNYIGVKYKGFYIVDKNSKKFGIKEVKNLALNKTEKGLALRGCVSDYEFEISFDKRSNGSVSVGMNLFGKNKNVRRAVPLVVETKTDRETNLLVLDFFNSGIKPCIDKTKGKSEFHIAVGKPNANAAITIINSLPSKFYSEFVFEVKGGKTEIGFATDFPYSYDGEYFSERASIYTSVPATEAIESETRDYLDEEFEHPIGWSTWDYYFRDVSDECIRENTEFIFNDAELKKSVQYIAIDDGWNQADGDWFEGGRIKSGLKATVDYIKSKGFKAGVWTAPVRVDMLAGSAMRKIAPSLVKNEYGDPLVYDAMYVLDPTHPIGKAFVKEIYSGLKSCGFDFYKVDFLDYVIHSDRFFDTKVGHYDVLRMLLSDIRACVGADAHIMGCNLPYGTGKGFVQSRRTGLDIHNNWGHFKKCTEFYLAQFASHGKVYFNDLDYLVVRGAETGDNEEPNNVTNPNELYLEKNPPKGFVWRYGKDCSYNEAKFWATVVLMSGSSIFMGDRFKRLNDVGLNLIKKTIENADFVAAKPLDILECNMPSIWYKNNQVFIFNWGEENSEFSVKTDMIFGKSELTLKDVYTEKKYVVNNGGLKVNLAPHESLALKGE